MKLRNKKTGEIDDFIFEVITNRIDLYRRVGYSKSKNIWHYNSLNELNEEWEDYEEPRNYWYLNTDCEMVRRIDASFGVKFDNREIGNYFETKEEAEKAVEKLKAWKRLKDKGFKFDNVNGCWIEFTLKSATSNEVYEQGQKDLHLLFGGEE